MYKLFRALLGIVWVLDVLDFPQVEFLDTTFPVNTLAWLLIFFIIPTSNAISSNSNNK